MTKLGLSKQEVMQLVNRYIGVNGGYLGDFSYRTHAEFYPEYCDLDINPDDFEGTTRERFIQIVLSLKPADQAKVVRGVVDRFPPADDPSTRTEQYRQDLLRIAQRLEGGGSVPVPAVTSHVVARAISDVETLLRTSGATSGVDRIHTALHGYLIAACSEAGIAVDPKATMTALLKVLRKNHPSLVNLGPRAHDIERILNSCATILDSMNPVRNQASIAHPNPILLDEAEALLVINVARTLLGYFSAKLQ